MSQIRLVIADVDGTLLTPDKQLTERARQAVLALRPAGIAFAITSGRPPRGMTMLAGPLELTTPIAAFNGAMLVHPDMSPIEEHSLPATAVGQIVNALERHHLGVWLYRGADWLVRALDAPHVEHERRTVRFSPTSDDLPAVARCEADAYILSGPGESRAPRQARSAS